MAIRSAARYSLQRSVIFLCLLTAAAAAPATGDPLDRITVPPGYRAEVHVEGLSGPDGLAFSPTGILYVAEEAAGRVTAVDEDGTLTTVVDGLTSPEGIAFDASGTLYVVEDMEAGRLLGISPSGTVTVLTGGLDAPEGVAVEPGGKVLVTESNVQFTGSPFQYATAVTRFAAGYGTETVERSTWFWSYAGIAIHESGTIYVANEASGIGTTDSIFAVHPESGDRSVFCTGLVACEGLRFLGNGDFPLLVVEEDLGNGRGRLSLVDETGSSTPFATGFLHIEDVAVDARGRIFVSEDGSGSIIRLVQAGETVAADLTCQPGTGTLPLTTVMTLELRNLSLEHRRTIAARIDVTTAGALSFPGWRRGWTNLAPGAGYATGWSQAIPALGSMVGTSTFTLVAEDVTPAPWNQPPYPPAGQTAASHCTVTGTAP